MKYFLSLVSIFTLFVVTAHAEERFKHYAGLDVTSTAQAVKALKTEAGEIQTLLKQTSLSDSQLERIHEITYTLENATDFLIAQRVADQNTLDNLDEAVQAVHNSSENHEEAAVRKWVPNLVKAIHSVGMPKMFNASAQATGKNEYKIIIKDHKFYPAELTVPANVKIKLIVENQDATPEEFESNDFRREKIIAGNSHATIHVSPLEPGSYKFFGEFNEDTAQGTLIVK